MITESEKQFMYFQLGSSGSFHTSLYNTYLIADNENKQKLQSIFPELEIVNRYLHEDGYWQDLCERWNQNNKQTTTYV